MRTLVNRTFDEMTIGETASLSRTVTQRDIDLFATVTGDVNPAHVDPAYAAGKEYRQFWAKLRDGSFHSGEFRRVAKDGLNLASVELLPPEPTIPMPSQHSRLADLLATVLPQLGEVYTDIEMHLDDAAWVGHRVAEILPIPLPQKQALLELLDPLERLDALAAMATVSE